MCGFVCAYNRNFAPLSEHALEVMRDTIAHRGPDDAGSYVDGPAGLGHRRLSIVDLSGGHQPMSDPTGRVWIAYNGETYNHLELRRELEEKGYPFKTVCDTEVILAGYVTQGVSFFERLNGIFSFAIWDGNEKQMVLVRDRLGVKPLYLWMSRDLLVAGSEVKALLAHPDIPARVRLDSIPEYLAFRQLAGRDTMIEGITTVAPGEIVICRKESDSRHLYWDLPSPDREAPVHDEGHYVGRLDELVRSATRMQLMSDVPLGTFNSGGVDSSLVTSYVAELREGILNTFCVGLEDEALDERPYAQLVADKYQTSHRTLVVEGRDFADHLPRVNWHLDEPANHPNTVAMYLLSQWTKEFATVVLTGEGCDEFFAGYPRYRIARLLQRVGAFRPLIGAFSAWLPAAAGSRLERLKRAFAVAPQKAIRELARYVPDDELKPILGSDITTFTADRTAPLNAQDDLVAEVLEQDQRNYIQSVLNRLDKASMAFGVEARVPLLDHRILEFAAEVPTALKIRSGENKYIVKKLAEKRLPQAVVYRKKSGLAMPLAEWFRDPRGLGRYLDMLDEPRSRQRDHLEPGSLERLVQSFRQGTEVRAEMLWALVNLELWHRGVEDVEHRATPAVSTDIALASTS